MSRLDRLALPGVLSAEEVAATASWITHVQEPSGAIPWFPGGPLDVWDHVECAMALSAAGRSGEARRAFEWLRRTQRRDGSWPLRIRDGIVEDAGADANHCAYVAVGVWHHLLVSADESFARRMWPVVVRAMDFALGLQTARGEVRWARDAAGRAAGFALLAASASTHHSLRCAVALGERLDDAQPDWELAAAQLGHAIEGHPEAFADRSRWSMDWYYPVLGGAVRGDPGDRRLAGRWEEFVIPGVGIRCVSDRPWVTGAETCELALALHAMRRQDEAMDQVASMQHLRDEDGAYWTGLHVPDGRRWPVERSTWTAAAVVLATDAMSRVTGGSAIFRDAAPPALSDEVDLTACADALEHS